MIDAMDVDFGRTADDYVTYRLGFPGALIDRLAALRVFAPGDRVVDVGTGTGSLARLFAQAGCDVTAVDPAKSLLVEAWKLDRKAGVDIHYVVATAEDTGLPAASADVVTAGQCWHWFDRPKAAAEARRILRPRGRLVICHFDWLPFDGNVVERTEQLILRHNPRWPFAGGTGIYPAWTVDVAAAGFRRIETFSFDVALEYSHEAWRGRVRASAGIAATLPRTAVDRFDAELTELLAASFPDPLAVPHRVWVLITRSP